MKRGTLVVMSGFSGVGKGTVTRTLVHQYGYKLSISATTREPRVGEVDGKDYFFKTDEEFVKMIEENGFIEYAGYVGHRYGTPRAYVESELAKGNTVILEIEVQGAMSIKAQYPDAVLIFITAPTPNALRERLEGRGTEAESVIEERLRKASEEARSIPCYDYLVCNETGKLEECVATVHSIIDSAACKKENNLTFIDELIKAFAEE